MNLQIKYMGLNLRNPLVIAPSPLTEKLDNFSKLEENGAGAIVMHSIFEEQIKKEQLELDYFLVYGTESYAESLSYFPNFAEFKVGPDSYLELIRKAKEKVSIPIIGSINCVSVKGWTNYAKLIEEAGADAIELNVYFIPTNPDLSSEEIENHYVEIVREVKKAVKIPVAIKLSPFFTNFSNMAKRLDEAGADALVLFNRFYQPDIDIEKLEVLNTLEYSSSFERRLPLQWIAILYNKIKADLAATTGIHTYEDVIKMIMAGARVTMLCSTILKNGISSLSVLLKELQNWMEKKGYDSISEIEGILSQKNIAEPSAYERANYMKIIKTYTYKLH